jgi:hypothetical protein
MAEWFGDDLNMVVLPNGDFYHASAVVVDTTDWSLSDFRQFDACPAELRQKLAVMIDSIKRAEQMSVVEITVDRNGLQIKETPPAGEFAEGVSGGERM